MKLFISAVTKLAVGIALLGALLFLPCGSFNYPNAWLFLGVLFAPMLIFGVVLFIKSPSLLQKRLSAKEKSGTQRGVVAASGLIFLVGFIASSLDYRFSVTRIPTGFVIAAAVIFLLGYLGYAEVMRENAYLSRTIEVQSGQSVVSDGLYGIVRHPMYLFTILMFLTIPVILGSLIGLIPFLFYPLLIVIRILNEEKLLTEELQGYSEYKKKVKYRLIPFIW